MLSLNEIWIALGSVLAIVAALHAYAHWSIRNIDTNTQRDSEEETHPKRFAPTAQSGEMSAIPVRAQNRPPRQP